MRLTDSRIFYEGSQSMKRVLTLMIVWLAAVAGAHAATPWTSNCITPIAVGQSISGTLATSDCTLVLDPTTDDVFYTDVYAFSGTQGQRIAISMSSATVDSWLKLHSVNDKE